MEVEAAKLIGAGLAVIGMIGSGIGIGSVFSSFIIALAIKLFYLHRFYECGICWFNCKF